jgi:hypothetical protein
MAGSARRSSLQGGVAPRCVFVTPHALLWVKRMLSKSVNAPEFTAICQVIANPVQIFSLTVQPCHRHN